MGRWFVAVVRNWPSRGAGSIRIILILRLILLAGFRIARRRHYLGGRRRNSNLRRCRRLRARRCNLTHLRYGQWPAAIRLNGRLPLRKRRGRRGRRCFSNNRASQNRCGWLSFCRRTAARHCLDLRNGRRSHGVHWRRCHLARVDLNGVVRNWLPRTKGLLASSHDGSRHSLVDVRNVCDVHGLVDHHVCVVIVNHRCVHGRI